MYEEEYFVGDRSPIIFGYASIFYRANAWYRFQKVAALIKRHVDKGRALDVVS